MKGFNRDSTNLKKIEELAESMSEMHNAMHNLFKYARDLICISKVDGSIILVSENWEKLLGFSTKEIRSIGWKELVHPDDLCSIYSRLIAKEDKYCPVENFFSRWRTKSGSYVKLCWSATKPIDGKIYSIARTCPLMDGGINAR